MGAGRTKSEPPRLARSIGLFQLIRIVAAPPAVILTASSLADSLEAFDVGVVDYEVKPIPYERFLRAMNRMLARQPERPPRR